jgi:RimJ/RimL family protein N-acetyltransferase
MIELKKLEQADFPIYKSWISSQAELFQFAGPIFSFPLTDQQLYDYITDPRRIAYKAILTKSNEIIGCAELNKENTKPRLSRILIGDKNMRNRGLGKLMIDKLLEKIFYDYNYLDADLNVFDWNKSAIKCYLNAGFKINPELEYKHNYNGVTWTAINMIITKFDWININSKRENKTYT